VQVADLLVTPEYTAAVGLWRQGQFWETHEALEPLWLRLSGPDRELTHGIILLAAALHKARTSPTGGWRNFHKALRHLEDIPETYQGIRVAELIEEVRKTLETPSYRPGFPLL
jgi:predicted metal-dependent hydrolase